MLNKIEAIICPNCGEMETAGEQRKKIDPHAQETIIMNQDSVSAIKEPCSKCSKPDTRF